jgi:YVTN family beta-propeller protein
VISTATDSVTATVNHASFYEPYAVAVSPDGSRAWVANKKGASSTGSVTVIDTATNTVSGTVDDTCFSSPEGIVATASTVYVVNRETDTVCTIDSTSLAVVDEIAVGSEPRFAVATPDGKTLYVANGGGSVSKIDTETDVVTTLQIPGANSTYGIAISQVEGLAYVTDEDF